MTTSRSRTSSDATTYERYEDVGIATAFKVDLEGMGRTDPLGNVTAMQCRLQWSSRAMVRTALVGACVLIAERLNLFRFLFV